MSEGHSAACVVARARVLAMGRSRREEERRDYPWMADVWQTGGRAAVEDILACPHWSHDAVRIFDPLSPRDGNHLK